MRRRVLALGAVLAVAAMAGCFGPSEIPEEELNAEATYDWNTSANATFELSKSSYTAVVRVENASTVEVWQRDVIEGERPVRVRALRFQFPNGTVVKAANSSLAASVGQDRTELQLPAREGRVGYTDSRTGKQFSTPAFVSGSYAVVLPPNTRIGVPFLSQASPGGWTTTIRDGRMIVQWSEVSGGSVSVRYYLQRDLLLFGSLVGIALLVGVAGALYYLRQIRALEDQREEIGLDVDYDDDDLGDDGPPPGMR